MLIDKDTKIAILCITDETTKFVKPDTHVGYMFGELVTCLKCKVENSIDLYQKNIYPYKQSCHTCGELMVFGASKSWCELYPRVSCIQKITLDLER